MDSAPGSMFLAGGKLSDSGGTITVCRQTKAGRVTIAGHPSHDLAPGALNSVLKQAELKKEVG